MNKLIAFLLFTILLSSNTFASMPVEVTIKGCIEDGRLISGETDFGTHQVQRDYKIKVYDHKDKSPIDLRQYNGKIVKIKGYLLPGDVFYVDRQSIIALGNCPTKKKLSLKEQEELARELFIKLSKTDASDTKVFIELYGRVIEECPETERAQEAYWRLSNLYLQAFDKPDYGKIAALLEEAVRRYPDTPATPHYKQRLLRAYEETMQWQKAVVLYEEGLKANPEILKDPQNAATMIAYADALSGSGNKKRAIEILNRVIAFGDKIEDWLLSIAKDKVKELTQKM